MILLIYMIIKCISKWQQTFIIARLETSILIFQTLFITTENEESVHYMWEKQVCLIIFLNCKTAEIILQILQAFC